MYYVWEKLDNKSICLSYTDINMCTIEHTNKQFRQRQEE